MLNGLMYARESLQKCFSLVNLLIITITLVTGEKDGDFIILLALLVSITTRLKSIQMLVSCSFTSIVGFQRFRMFFFICSLRGLILLTERR